MQRLHGNIPCTFCFAISYCCRSSAFSLCGILLLPVPRALAGLPLDIRSTSSRLGREAASFLHVTDRLISLTPALHLKQRRGQHLPRICIEDLFHSFGNQYTWAVALSCTSRIYSKPVIRLCKIQVQKRTVEYKQTVYNLTCSGQQQPQH